MWLETVLKIYISRIDTSFLYKSHGSLAQPLGAQASRLLPVEKAKQIQIVYLEVIDYQLFAVNTVEKRIGYYLWGYGKWRFNDFNLLLRANVRFGWQNEGREEK